MLQQTTENMNERFKALIRYVPTRFVAYLYRSLERYIYNFKFIIFELSRSDSKEDKDVLSEMIQLNNVCDVLMILELALILKVPSERHQSDYLYPWDYCRNEDHVNKEINKRIECLKNGNYNDIEIMTKYGEELSALKFCGVSLTLTDSKIQSNFTLETLQSSP